MTRNAHARWCANNFNNADFATISYSSQASAALAAANTRDPSRSRYWSPSGNFTISGTYTGFALLVNDGADKTALIADGNYATPALFAIQIQTQLNAVSTNWVCTWSTTTNRFTINRTSGTAVLRVSLSSTYIFEMLGYTIAGDRTGGPFIADEVRIHSREFYRVDLGLAKACPAFFAVGPIDEPFTLSETATVRVIADNVPFSDAYDPAFESIVTPNDRGIFHFMDDDDATDIQYRYWGFEFVDRMNPGGPSAFKFSNIYFGDYVTSTISNVATGLEVTQVDPTDSDEAISGQRFFNRRAKYRRFSGCSVELMEPDVRRDLQRMFSAIGVDTPFYLAIDPTLSVSETADELAAFGYFDGEPSCRNVIRDLYTVAFNFREAV